MHKATNTDTHVLALHYANNIHHTKYKLRKLMIRGVVTALNQTFGYLAASLDRYWLMRAQSGTPCLYKCKYTHIPEPALFTFST